MRGENIPCPLRHNGKAFCAERLRGEGGETAAHHGGDAAGHGKGFVIGLRRHQQGKTVITALYTLIQMSLFITGDHQMRTVGNTLIGEIKRGNTFRAVTGTGKGNQQYRLLLRQIIRRIGDDVGCRDCRDTFAGQAAQYGRNHLADKGGGSGAGQNDAQVVLSQQRREKGIQLCAL